MDHSTVPLYGSPTLPKFRLPTVECPTLRSTLRPRLSEFSTPHIGAPVVVGAKVEHPRGSAKLPRRQKLLKTARCTTQRTLKRRRKTPTIGRIFEKMFFNARTVVPLIISRDHRRMPFRECESEVKQQKNRRLRRANWGLRPQTPRTECTPPGYPRPRS